MKPKKKEVMPGLIATNYYFDGYNLACDDWEEFLPSVEEIEEIFSRHTVIANSDILYREGLAKAIRKRLEENK